MGGLYQELMGAGRQAVDNDEACPFLQPSNAMTALGSEQWGRISRARWEMTRFNNRVIINKSVSQSARCSSLGLMRDLGSIASEAYSCSFY